MEIFAITAPDWQPFVAKVEGRFVEASNATLLGETAGGDRVVYKPVAGVRPLWDFPAHSLATREVWTYRVDRALGIGAVPETVLGDGIYGPGAVQRFVDASADEVVFDMVNSAHPRLMPIAALDVITNNADRKAGHILRDANDSLWAIDHGLTFHTEPKLRTILWGLAGCPLPDDLLNAADSLRRQLRQDLGELMAAELTAGEVSATLTRVEALIDAGVHPEPPEDRPAIPWPPY